MAKRAISFNEAPAFCGGECWLERNAAGIALCFNEAPAFCGGE